MLMPGEDPSWQRHMAPQLPYFNVLESERLPVVWMYCSAVDICIRCVYILLCCVDILLYCGYMMPGSGHITPLCGDIALLCGYIDVGFLSMTCTPYDIIMGWGVDILL